MKNPIFVKKWIFHHDLADNTHCHRCGFGLSGGCLHAKKQGAWRDLELEGQVCC